MAPPVVRPFQAAANARQRVLTGFVAFLMLTAVGGAAAIVLGEALTNAVSATDPATLNRRMAERVMRIDRELRAHALRPDRVAGEPLVPSDEGFVDFVRDQPDGLALLTNPWSGAIQGYNLPLADVSDALTSAAELAAGGAGLALSVPLGPGQRPGEGPGDRVYGTLLYDMDAPSGRYVLYGLGQAGDQAIVVQQATGPR